MDTAPTPAPMQRREFMRLGLAGFSSLTLPQLLQQRSEGAQNKERTAIILVWLPGGASHIETYDPKPLAGSAYRGPYNPISTNQSGTQICELLPRHAQIADRFNILRSVVHSGFCHQQGTQQLLTGHPVLILKQKPDHPDCFAITNSLRFDGKRDIPNYITVNGVNYAGSAYLGPTYEPFMVTGDPNSPKFNVPNVGLADNKTRTKLARRLSLLDRLDTLQRDVDYLSNMEAVDDFSKQAWSMLTSKRAKEAFDISKEPAKVRDRYGRNRWGQQTLLARRLVEAGVDLVTTQFSGPLCGRVGNWDDHAVNHHVFDGMKYRCPFYDQAVAALIEDIYERGLDRRVMVVVTGEFGRTPKINYQKSTGKGIASGATGTVQPGRDHWPRATSILFAGGGMKTGQVIGATDVRGSDVTQRRVGRGDFLATIYNHLGVDYENLAIPNFAGRPIPIVQEGKPIKELASVSS